MPPKITPQQRSFLRALGRDKRTPRTAPSSPSKTHLGPKTLKKAAQTPLPVSTVDRRAEALAAARRRRARLIAYDKERRKKERERESQESPSESVHQRFSPPPEISDHWGKEFPALTKLKKDAKKLREKERQTKSEKGKQTKSDDWLGSLEKENVVKGKFHLMKIGGRRTTKRRKRVKRRKTRRKHRTRRRRRIRGKRTRKKRGGRKRLPPPPIITTDKNPLLPWEVVPLPPLPDHPDFDTDFDTSDDELGGGGKRRKARNRSKSRRRKDRKH